MISLEVTGTDGHSKNAEFEHSADCCPYCHKGIEPLILKTYIDRRIDEIVTDTISWVIFKCPMNKCGRIFIGIYVFARERKSNFFHGPYHIYPVFPEEKTFNDVIINISPSFVKIYNQAYFAEQHDLDLIIGPGYRKALEFLIKDYALKKSDESKKEDILRKPLGHVIDSFIDDPRIKPMAKRAAWLGNDETHYLRKWKSKDLDELKTLIELTIRWIEMVELSDGYIEEMPE